MKPADEEIRVIALPLPPEEWGWAITPEGEEALDESLTETRVRLTEKGLGLARELAAADGEPTGNEPTLPIPPGVVARARAAAHERAVADEARDLARQRAGAARDRADAHAWLEEQAALGRNPEIPEPRQPLF